MYIRNYKGQCQLILHSSRNNYKSNYKGQLLRFPHELNLRFQARISRCHWGQ
jgi:hypothetical protein